MSAQGTSFLEQRCRDLTQEVKLLKDQAQGLDDLVKQILQQIANARQASVNGGGSGNFTIGWAFCPSGIASATVTGTGTTLTLTPSFATDCLVATGRASGAWVLPGSTTTVFNDYPDGSGTGVASTHFVQVYQDPADSSWRVLGEQCS